MKSNLILILSSFSLMAHADVNQLDEFLAKRHQYTVPKYCEKALRKTPRSAYESKEIKSAIESLAEINFDSDHFFHYTDDEGQFLRNAVKAQDFKAVLKYPFNNKQVHTYAAGPGFYISANPFTSSDYGQYQFIVQLEPKLKAFNMVRHLDILKDKIHSLYKRDKNFEDCATGNLLVSLVLDENNVDLVFYNDQNEWFTLLNEDVIVSSKWNRVSSQDPISILTRMTSNGDLEILQPLLTEMTYPRKVHTSLGEVLRSYGSNIYVSDFQAVNTFAGALLRTKLFSLETLINILKPSDDTSKRQLANLYHNLESEQQKKLIQYFLSDDTQFNKGSKAFSSVGLDLKSIALSFKDQAMTNFIITWVEANYSRETNFTYVNMILDSLENFAKNPIIQNHFNSYICRELYGNFSVFKTLIREELDKERKKQLKKLKKTLCSNNMRVL